MLFFFAAALSPWLAGPASAQSADGCTTAANAAGVVINEFFANPSESPERGFEWIEIHHAGTGTVNLSGWSIAAATSGDFDVSDEVAFPKGTTIEAGEYLVVAAEPAKGKKALDVADVLLPETRSSWLGNAGSNADILELRDCILGKNDAGGTPVDTVVYGSPNSDGWLDGTDSLAPKPGTDESVGRAADGVDTDLSGDDFVVYAFPTPGLPNDAEPEGCGGPESGIVINEFISNPKGSDTDAEWIELYHGGSEVVDLADWRLEAATSSFSNVYTFVDEVMEPGDRLLIGGAKVPNADIVASFTLGNAGSNSDAVRLVDCAGLPADTVVYGSPNDGDPPFADDRDDVATSLAPAPGEAASLARLQDGRDTDDNALDFVVATNPSPGAPNPEVEPVVCEPDSGVVFINEILPDPEGDDSGKEWFELYNASGEAVSVAGWSIAAGTQDYEALDITLQGGTEVPANGFLVIAAGEKVKEADIVFPFSMGNGTGTDGVRLFDCDGNIVDTVLYGESPNEDLMEDDQGKVVDPYGDPGSNDSLAREVDGVDSDSAVDWKVTARPSPGATNVLQSSPDTGEDPFDRGGCGGGDEPPTGTDGPDSGCATLGPLRLGLGLGLLSLALVRRRRSRP